MDFGTNSELERVAFGSKCVLHRVRVSQCRPSRVIQNSAEQPPPRIFTPQIRKDATLYNLPGGILQTVAGCQP